MKAPKPKTTHEPAPAGTHVARLYRIVHVGTVPDSFQGQPRQTDQIHFTFELCGEKKVFKEGEPAKPLNVSTRFLTYSMGKKANLRKLIEGMAGVKMTEDEAYNFDTDTLIGDACLLTVVHTERDGNTYANIQNVAPLMKGMEAPAMFNTAVFVDVNASSPEDIEALPDFLKEKIKSSVEYANRFNVASGAPVDAINPDDIPF